MLGNKENKYLYCVGPLNIIIASGQFTPSDSLSFDPLTDLVEVIKRDAPQICILIGPFLEASHEKVAELPVTFEELFVNQMVSLKETLKDVDTQVLIVSSHKEAHHVPVYPTPPYKVDLERYNRYFHDCFHCREAMIKMARFQNIIFSIVNSVRKNL